MPRLGAALIWGGLLAALAIPVAASLTSPLLEWRRPVYIASGLAGIVGMALMLLQPLLVGGYLPGLGRFEARRLHRWTGALIVTAVVGHVAGLWITSPPDMVDALTFTSPTPFSAWGVVAMWALFATALLAALRRRLQIRWRHWRVAHSSLALVIVGCTVVHALLIEGTMETVSKVALCLLVAAATVKALYDLRVWSGRPHSS